MDVPHPSLYYILMLGHLAAVDGTPSNKIAKPSEGR